MKIVIAGVPRAGKTTLAETLRVRCQPFIAVKHTDDLIHGDRAEWSQISDAVATWFDVQGPWLVEGIRAVHALRKFLRAHEMGTTCDRVIWLGTPRVALTPGQATMAKGLTTVWREIRAELLARNVQVEEP